MHPLKSLQRPWNLKWDYRRTRVARTHDLVPKYFLRSSDWLMRSELGYFALSLLSGLNDVAATLIWIASINMSSFVVFLETSLNYVINGNLYAASAFVSNKFV